jgi:small subunit ribosomal protein S4
MRYTGPVCRFCRREGEKLYLKGSRCESAKCPIARGQSFKPGVHGPKGTKGKKSEYGKQLAEKQKAKIMYGIQEKQFKNYYGHAEKAKITTDALMQTLERRLDNVIYRSGFATSRAQARQIVRHGGCTVNNKPVNIPSYQMKIGDTFAVSEKAKGRAEFGEVKKKKDTAPSWMKVDLHNLNGEILREPGREDFEKNIQTHMIVEFYSK